MNNVTDIANIYMPEGTVNTSQTRASRTKRLLLVGAAGSGKSWSAVTFPNPFILDYDNNLQHDYFRDLAMPTIPCYDVSATREIKIKERKVIDPREWIIQWLAVEGKKFSEQQTIILDSLTGLSDIVRILYEKEVPTSKSGHDDKYWFWRMWAAYFRELFSAVRDLPCNVVVIMHENEMRDSETNRVTSVKPLIQGQEFSPRIPSFFTDVYRQIAIPKENLMQLKPGMKSAITYWWQIKSDRKFDAARTTIITDNVLVPATYKSFSGGV